MKGARSRALPLSDARLHRDSLSDQVADTLVQYILDHGLRPGDSMPSTADLVEHLGVSRNVVREAIADLSGRGILRRTQGRECVVGEVGSRELGDLLNFHVRQAERDPMHLQEVREALEVMSAQLAATRRTPAQLHDLKQQLEVMRTPGSDASFLEADHAFHLTLARASGNDLLALILDSLEPLLRDTRRRMMKEGKAFSHRSVFKAHEAICAAVEAGDAEAAVTAMRTHLELARSYLRTTSGRVTA